jgi:predicted urease superfamily metal-dependent hydrolase
VVDSHTHLDLCEPPNSELVAAAERAGVERLLTVGIDGASCRAALAAAEDFPQVYAAIGRHPNAARGFDDADLAELRALAAHEGCVAIGETGLDFYREGAPRADQERAFAAQIALARATGKALVIHTRAAGPETLAQLAAEAGGLNVVMHCFSMPDELQETSPTRAPATSPRRPGGFQRTACSWRPTRPTSPRPRCARSETSRRSSHTRSPSSRSSGVSRGPSWARPSSATPDACSVGHERGGRAADPAFASAPSPLRRAP